MPLRLILRLEGAGPAVTALLSIPNEAAAEWLRRPDTMQRLRALALESVTDIGRRLEEWLSEEGRHRHAECYIRQQVGPATEEYAISAGVAERACTILRDLRTRVPGLGVPTVACAPDGAIGFTWDTPRHAINVRVCPDLRLERFHENFASGEVWFDDEGQDPGERLLERLRHVAEPQ